MWDLQRDIFRFFTALISFLFLRFRVFISDVSVLASKGWRMVVLVHRFEEFRCGTDFWWGACSLSPSFYPSSTHGTSVSPWFNLAFLSAVHVGLVIICPGRLPNYTGKPFYGHETNTDNYYWIAIWVYFVAFLFPFSWVLDCCWVPIFWC